MKKKGILALLLVLWVLLFNTFFALRVEVLMTPRVTTTEPRTTATSIGTVVSLDCQFWDDGGGSVLYQVYDGMVWESGTCVRILNPEQYTVMEKDIPVIAFTTLVQYATKPPRAGEPVDIVTERNRQDDVWLAVYPEKVWGMKSLGKNIAVEAQSDAAVLLSVKDSEQPFMEKRAITAISEPEIFTMENTMMGGPQISVYSLSEVDKFFGQLPVLAALIAMFFAFLILWIHSCFLARNLRKNRKYLTVNAAIAAVLTIALPLCINALNFPSSLLPQNNIAEYGHYSNEFSQIFSALETFAAEGSQAAMDTVAHSKQMLFLSMGVVLGGIILSIGIVLLERALLRKRSKLGLSPNGYAPI